jgi:predicted nuclease with TOPRIM domain
MTEPIVQRSQRFAKAARAERDRLARRRSQISKKREDLQGRIDLLDEELEAVDREITALDTLALPSDGAREISLVEAEHEGGPTLLRGGKIRILAVPFLLRAQGTAPIHYRAWLELLMREGFAVAGKRPDAVFLNQVVRSPLIRATTKAGYYTIDLDAVDQLRETLHKQQTQLATLMRQAPVEVGEAFNEYREQQRELNTAIARTERELDEAVSAIKAWEGTEDFGASETRAA